MTAGEIAALVKGELVGEADTQLDSAHTLEKAEETQLAFWERRPGQRELPPTRAGCVIVDPGTSAAGRTLIRTRHPRSAFAQALRTLLAQAPPDLGTDVSATVDSSAIIGTGVSIGPYVVVEAGAEVGADSILESHVYVGGGAVIGRGCRLHPGARVYGSVRLGDRVTLHAGAVIGSDGFGLVFEKDHYERFPQVGGVEIGSDVEIGANSCVDRGALDNTRIGSGTKLDNLVHIGHNCQIGQHVVMAAQVGLSGGVVVENYAVLGGQVGIGDRARIGARVQLGGQGGLLPDKTIGPGGAYWGTPARPLREQLTRQALVNRLPRILDEVKKLRARVRELEQS